MDISADTFVETTETYDVAETLADTHANGVTDGATVTTYANGLTFEFEEYDELSFKVQPQVLAAALKEAMSAVQQANDTIYFALSKDEDTEFFSYNMISSDAGDGRLTIGVQGYGRNHVRVDVPVEDLSGEGAFIINEAEKLINWAGTKTGTVEIVNIRDDEKTYLELRHSKGHKKVPIHLFYEMENLQEWFTAVTDFFTQPEELLASSSLTNMFNRAEKTGPGEMVSGLIWRSTPVDEQGNVELDADGHAKPGIVEYVTRSTLGQHSIATSQKAFFDSEASFEWEVTPVHLKAISTALKAGMATYRYEPAELNDEDEVRKPPVLQLAYSRPIGTDGTMYVHRQLMIERENQSPLKQWRPSGDPTDDSPLFTHPDCKLFATLPSEATFRSLEGVWALDQSAMITIEMGIDDDENPVVNLISGDKTNPDKDDVPATHGDSQVASFLLHPDLLKPMQTIVADATMFQLRSFPNTAVDSQGNPIGGELPNALVVVPLNAGDDPTQTRDNPDRYLIVSWVP